jgi:hypothetical protein
MSEKAKEGVDKAKEGAEAAKDKAQGGKRKPRKEKSKHRKDKSKQHKAVVGYCRTVVRNVFEAYWSAKTNIVPRRLWTFCTSAYWSSGALFTNCLEEVFSETGDLNASRLALALSISKVGS